MTAQRTLTLRIGTSAPAAAQVSIRGLVTQSVRRLAASLGLPVQIAVDVHADADAIAPRLWIDDARLRYSRDSVLRARMSATMSLPTVAEAKAGAKDLTDPALAPELCAEWSASIVEHALAARPQALISTGVIAGIAESFASPPDLAALLETTVSCGVGFGSPGAMFEAILALPPGSTDARAEQLLTKCHPRAVGLELAPKTLQWLLEQDSQRDARPFATVHERMVSALGLPLPSIKLSIDPNLAANAYRLRINHLSEPAQPLPHPGTVLLLASDGSNYAVALNQTVEPIPAESAIAEHVSPFAYLAHDLYDRLSKRASRLLDPATLQRRYSDLGKPTLVALACTSKYAVQIPRLLRRLLDEQVPITDLARILDGIVDHHTIDSPPPRTNIVLTRGFPVSSDLPPEEDQLCESVRKVLGRALLSRIPYGAQIAVMLLSPEVEAQLVSAPTPEWLEALREKIVESIETKKCDALLTTVEIRALVRTLCADALPEVPVLSYQELPAEAALVPVDRIHVPPIKPEALPRAAGPAIVVQREVGGISLWLADAHTGRAVIPDLLPDRFLPPAQRDVLARRTVFAGDVGGDATSLEQQGWAVVVPTGGRGADLEALIKPLIDYRIGEQRAAYRIFRVPAALDSATAAEWVRDEFEEIPEDRRPRYLLILGTPKEVSLALQFALAPLAAVGRLSFTLDKHYTDYANQAVKAEQRRRDEIRTSLFLCDDQSGPVEQAKAQLFGPCQQSLTELARDSRMRLSTSATATLGKAKLLDSARSADFLFTVSHGAGGNMSYDERTQLQGALLTAPGELFTGADVASGPFLPDGIWLMFACYGGGTPTTSSFDSFLDELYSQSVISAVMRGIVDQGKLRPTEDPFIAALPMNALANPEGPLAVIAHVDLSWAYSFSHEGRSRFSRYYTAVKVLMQQHLAGFAMEQLTRSCSTSASELAELHLRRREHERGRGPAVDAQLLARTWMARQDLRNFVLLGDPAVRLRLATN